VSDTATSTAAAPCTPILDDSEVGQRKLLLAGLQAALAASDIPFVFAGRHRLVLRSSQQGSQGPSGPVDPALFILGRAPTVVTTDGACFRLKDGREFPVSDIAAAAAAIRS
jgi:hypothetical protein